GTRFRHRSQALRTRAAEELQKHGLRLVVLMMREKNGISPCRRRGVRKRPIACMASFGLDAFPRLAADVDTVLDQWYATLTAQVGAKADPCVGVHRQSMMDVNRNDGERVRLRLRERRIEERYGIAAA